MNVIYLETSALLVWLFGQQGEEHVRKTIDKADQIATSALTLIETERALIRAERLKVISPANAKKLRSLVNSTKSEWFIANISEAVQRQSMQAFPVEPIRTLDAIHLATAIVLLAAYPDLKMLSFDERITANSKLLRLQ